MAHEKKSIDPAVVAELEQSKNEVLKRIAEKLKDQMDTTCVSAGHNAHNSSHTASSGHTAHTSH